MKAIILIIAIVYTIANGYLYIRLMQTVATWPLPVKILLTLLFWIVAFSLFISIGMRNVAMPETLSRLMFNAGSIWMIFLLYMLMLLIASDLIKLFASGMGHTFLYALPVTICLLLYGYINYRHPKVEQIDITLSEKNVEQRESLKMVVVSDIHFGYGTGVEKLSKYVNLINSQTPDVILIVGDLIDNSLKPLLHAPFDKHLSALKAPQGIYMVPGNHEYISGIDACADYLKRTPVTLLRDSIVTLPCGVQIVGRDDRSNRNRQALEQVLSKTNPDSPIVVMDHQPYELHKADSLQVDMLFCGHTHRGQVWPISLITDKMYEQSHGYRKWQNAHVWVSSGLSLWGPPFRIGTNSDMAVINLKFNM